MAPFVHYVSSVDVSVMIDLNVNIIVMSVTGSLEKYQKSCDGRIYFASGKAGA